MANPVQDTLPAPGGHIRDIARVVRSATEASEALKDVENAYDKTSIKFDNWKSIQKELYRKLSDAQQLTSGVTQEMKQLAGLCSLLEDASTTFGKNKICLRLSETEEKLEKPHRMRMTKRYTSFFTDILGPVPESSYLLSPKFPADVE